MSKNVKKKETGNDESYVINMDSLMIPFAIVVAGLMIALALFFGTRNSSDKPSVSSDKTDVGEKTEESEVDENDGTSTVSIDDDAYLGDKEKATVAIVEFTDYECPYCERHYAETHNLLIKNFIDTGKAILVIRDYPLNFHDPVATEEAMAAQCAFSLGGNEAYFEFHNLIYENSKLNGEGVGGADKLAEFAGDIGVDVADFETCLEEEEFAEEIAKDLADGTKAGINGTPGFIIGKFDKDGNVKDGILLAGAYPYESFKAAIEKKLEE